MVSHCIDEEKGMLDWLLGKSHFLVENSKLREENKRLRQLVYYLGGDPDKVEEIEGEGEIKEERKTSFLYSALSLEEMKEMVEIPEKNYAVGKYQVTQALWKNVTGKNPSEFKGITRPVEKVSLIDCVAFCNKLSEMEGFEKVYALPEKYEHEFENLPYLNDDYKSILLEKIIQNLDANGYRLPTNKEWEFAARGNEDFEYAGSDNFDVVAWTSKNSKWETHDVGQKSPNGFGLYDMSGNVRELCLHKPVGKFWVCRGGSWRDGPKFARVSSCNKLERSASREIGFRLFRTIR
jgi:formylglycine-generating enzyme required for sulfatase activity